MSYRIEAVTHNGEVRNIGHNSYTMFGALDVAGAALDDNPYREVRVIDSQTGKLLKALKP